MVECGGAGQPVKINGVAIDETSYIKSGVDPSSFSFRVEVTAGHIFVMGDNRASSADSRYHQTTVIMAWCPSTMWSEWD